MRTLADEPLLDRAAVVGYRQGFFSGEDLAHAFATATALPVRLPGLANDGLAVGDSAGPVLLPSGSVAGAVLDRPRARTVPKRGRVVARGGALTAGRPA